MGERADHTTIVKSPAPAASHSEQNGEAPKTETLGSESLAARIRKRHDAQLSKQELFLPFPGWGGDLIVRYRVLPREAVERFVEQAQTGAVDIDSNADLLSAACSGIFLRDEETDERVEQVDENNLSIGYDERLMKLLGYEVTRVRVFITALADGNVYAVGAHAQKVIEWMEDTSRKVEGALQGESQASPR